MRRTAGDNPTPSRCTVEMFGGLSLRLPGQRPITRFRTQKTAALLAYLAYHRDRMHSREVLIELFWPDSSAGRMSLSVALSALRAQMEPPGVPAGSVVVTERTHVGVNPEAVTTDVQQFEELLERAAHADDPAQGAALRARAIDLHRPSLLPGYYDAWITPQQERLTDRYLNALQWMIVHFEGSGRPGQALEFARRAAQADPLSEEAGQELIRLLIACDQGAAAVTQYERMEAEFLENRGEAPSEATRRLLDPLAAGGGDAHAPRPAAAPRETRPAAPHPTDPGEAAAGGGAEAVGTVGTVTAVAEAVGAKPDAQRRVTPRALAPAAPHPVEHPLPLPLTRFYGREDELRRLNRLLGDPTARLITVTGPGGIGKTRLALSLLSGIRDRRDRNRPGEEAGEEWEEIPPLMREFLDRDFAGGDSAKEGQDPNAFEGPTFFVSLAHLTDAALIPAALREAVGASPGGAADSDPLAPVVQTLAGFPNALLTLDNFEHLTEEGAEVVETLLMRVPGLTCLVTSRQRLLLEGEHEFALGSLPLPRVDSAPLGADDAPLEELEVLLRRSPPVALFVDRAQLARPDFQLTRRNAAAVTDLVARLEGIPLAIELAAARAQVLTPNQILEQFDRRFDLLVSRTRARGALERHRSLRATLAWSYDLLPDPRLQRLFARLSVFRGGWDVESAQAVAIDTFPDREMRRLYLLDALAQLADASLIRSEESQDAHGEPCLRFTMLETLRAFAEECLEADEEETLRSAHALYFLHRAEEEEARVKHDASAEPAALAHLDADRGNLRTALNELSRGGKGEDDLYLTRLVVALYRYWRGRGHVREASTWFNNALARRERLRVLEIDGVLPPDERWALETKLLNNAAIFAIDRCDLAVAETLLEECHGLRKASGDLAGQAAALNNLANVAGRQGDYATALRRYAACVRLFRSQQEERGLGSALANIGMIYVLQGRYSRARRSLKRSLKIARRLVDRRGEASRLRVLGEAEMRDGCLREAEDCYRQSLVLQRELGDEHGQMFAVFSLGILAATQGDHRRAARLLASALWFLEDQSITLSGDFRRDLVTAYPDLGIQAGDGCGVIVGKLASLHAGASGVLMSLSEAGGYALSLFETAPLRGPSL